MKSNVQLLLWYGPIMLMKVSDRRLSFPLWFTGSVMECLQVLMKLSQKEILLCTQRLVISSGSVTDTDAPVEESPQNYYLLCSFK